MSLNLCFLYICLTLIVLSVGGRASNPFITYDKAREIWTEKKCLFPDPTNFQNATSLLEPCKETNTQNNTDLVKVCEIFFRLSIQMCYALSHSAYGITRLKQDVLAKTLNLTTVDVCHYASNLKISIASYLNELHNYTQCSQYCLNSAINTKPICELLISALCSFFGKNQCQLGEKTIKAESTSNSSTTVANLVTSTTSAPEKASISDHTTNKVEQPVGGNETAVIIESVTKKATDHPPVNDLPLTTKSIPDKEVDKTTTKLPDSKPTQKPDDAEWTDLPATKSENIEMTLDPDDSEGVTDDDDEFQKENTVNSKDPGVDGHQVSEDKGLKIQDPETSEEEKTQDSIKKVENIYTNPQSTSDDEESNGSGHFLAYFMTAVVICIAGYIIYHNKQKIMAFIIEGRSSHSGRQRSKGVKYTELKSNVEEVLPSLEKSATAKNFVY